jgi:hypothetical protein
MNFDRAKIVGRNVVDLADLAQKRFIVLGKRLWPSGGDDVSRGDAETRHDEKDDHVLLHRLSFFST